MREPHDCWAEAEEHASPVRLGRSSNGEFTVETRCGVCRRVLAVTKDSLL